MPTNRILPVCDNITEAVMSTPQPRKLGRLIPISLLAKPFQQPA